MSEPALTAAARQSREERYEEALRPVTEWDWVSASESWGEPSWTIKVLGRSKTVSEETLASIDEAIDTLAARLSAAFGDS